MGVSEDDAVTAAAACELLHNASLVHDDLQDRDVVRRGRSAVWKRFGPAAAVCLGDHLIAGSFALLARIPDPGKVRQLTALFAEATSSAVRGQLAEVATDPMQFPTPEEYCAMAAGKSGALFALPLRAAGILAGLAPSAMRAARSALEQYGVAYQIKDDLLDVAGGKEGRPAGADLAAGRANAVLVFYLAAHGRAAAETLAADLADGMAPRRRAWWLRELNRPETLAHALHKHAYLLEDAARNIAAALPESLANTLRLGLDDMVGLGTDVPVPHASDGWTDTSESERQSHAEAARAGGGR
jgi:geranylgeranyl pyrophosphate synthase